MKPYLGPRQFRAPARKLRDNLRRLFAKHALACRAWPTQIHAKGRAGILQTGKARFPVLLEISLHLWLALLDRSGQS